MDDLTASLVVLTITGLCVVGIFWFSHRSQKRSSAALQEMANRHGWSYVSISEPLAWGTEITGKNWLLTARSESTGQSSDSGSSNVQKTTIWKTEWITPAQFILHIGPRLSTGMTFPGILMPQMSGSLHEIIPPLEELSGRYLFLGNEQADLDFLLTTSIPHLLMEWPEKLSPHILINPHSLEIIFHGYRMDKPVEMERLILLGETFISIIEP